MTNSELKKLFYLNRDIDRLTERIRELEDPSRVITGLPGGTDISDKTGNAAIRLSALRPKLEAARLEAMDELKTLTEYIESIDDPLIRQIMQYRHVNGLSWERVAMMVGGGNTAEGCRQTHKRYLDSN